MRKGRFISMLVISGLLGTGLVACEKQGPAEKAGAKIDDVARDIQKDAKKAADDVQEAAEDLQEKLKD